ncbi:helix-turn-helix transcriptional regulator [Paracoccus tegillarcae]|uniref:LuxR family transcriptional regulator n=1 Tax=Paracoccus tegillarcae TaxID=1529068 RepID=A0A2K9F5Y2_9RHOB|nr:autoinducer binding domain-containing protein [Paracoccus tegillarcae]AUH34591.1 LuxR family transcriptional regulator [Paracoccus tegillarcae]
MLEAIIPNHEEELAEISALALTGYVMGFGLRFGRPDLIINRYPARWTQKYEEENYFFRDPLAVWTMARVGKTRWSEVSIPDPFDVLNEAAKFGLKYGATFVSKVDRKRSFMSMARPDREFTDAEMTMLSVKLDLWAHLFARSHVALSEKEVEALRMLRDGLTHHEASEKLDISVSALKLRLSGAQKKLGCRNTMTAVVKAVREGLI